MYDVETLKSLHEAWLNRDQLVPTGPWSTPEISPPSNVQHPYSYFLDTSVACILMAGGVSSRLGSDVPKGMFPIPPFNKTLFEIFFRRLVGFQRLYQRWPFIAIMTSQDTDEATRTFLAKADYFGVPPEQVSFFIQPSLPLLDEHGVFFEENGQFVSGPNGNGLLFQTLHQTDIPKIWQEGQVQALSILNIDNPLMDPFLPSLFRPILEQDKQAAISAIQRASEKEKVGILVSKNHRIHVVEYSEVPEEVRSKREDASHLTYPWANISVFCISFDMIEKLALCTLPLHFAKKVQKGKSIFKAEYFIFDLFPTIEKAVIVPLDRKRYFSPIKAKTGEDSLEEASLAFTFLQQDQAKQKRIQTLDPASLDPAELYGN